MASKKFGAGIFLLVSLVFVMNFASAAFNVTSSASYSVNKSSNTVYNVTINNSDLVSASNITQVNITISANFTFIAATNSTSAVGTTFTNTSTILTWANTTGLILNGTNQSFWFNATAAPIPGIYYINVSVLNSSGVKTVIKNISVNVTSNVSQSGVDFGFAKNYSIIAETTITADTPANTFITGNIGLNPAAGSFITGITCTNVNGVIYSSGGYTSGNTTCALTDPLTVLAARSAMETAYGDARGRTLPDATGLGAGEIGGMTLVPGLYKWSTPLGISTDLTLDCLGNTNAVFIFQMSSTLTTAGKVILAGGCQAKNIYWQTDTAATLAGSNFSGNILAGTAITIGAGVTLNGRAFAQSAVTITGSGSNVTFPGTATVTDTTNPTLILNAPSNASYTNSSNVTFNFTATDINLANCTFSLDGVINSTFVSPTNLTSAIAKNFTESLADGLHNWSVQCLDSSGNSNTSTTSYFTVDTVAPSVTFVNSTNFPAPGNKSKHDIVVNISATDGGGSGINSITIYLYNSTGLRNMTVNSTSNPAFVNFTGLSDGIYYINATANDTVGNLNSTGTGTRIVLLDTVAPTILINTPANGTDYSSTSNLLNVTTNDSGSGVSSVWYSLDGGVTNTTYDPSVIYVNFAEGNNNLIVWVNDSAGNVNSTTSNFSVTLPVVESNNGGGGGGEAYTGWFVTYPSISDQQLNEGYTQNIIIDGRIGFVFNNETHYLGVVSIDTLSNTATVNVSSTPQQKIMAVGEEWNVSLNEDNYDNVLVKLNSISNAGANLTIMGINELIAGSSTGSKGAQATNNGATSPSNVASTGSSATTWLWVIGVIIVALIITLIALLLKRANKEKKIVRSVRYSDRS